jgi:Cof subfamily protein (haloacid dehalogenase superfamily)
MDSKGWIALDIDGTITLDKYSVPKEVVAFLRSLQKSGWQIAMATGRPLAFAMMALSEFDFPYTFLAQNGSAVLEMPSQKLLFKSYIPFSSLAVIEKAYEGIEGDYVIYAGYEKGDFCYWRPHRLSQDERNYLTDLQKRQKEYWREMEQYTGPELSSFPLLKCFGNEAKMDLIAKRLRASGKFEVAKIRDPFVEGYYLLLVTDRTASKGNSLKKVLELKGRGKRVIAAGDDENDLSLLKVADIKIAMAHAPESLQEVATFIAPPTHEQGIIQALQIALRNDR